MLVLNFTKLGRAHFLFNFILVVEQNLSSFSLTYISKTIFPSQAQYHDNSTDFRPSLIVLESLGQIKQKILL